MTPQLIMLVPVMAFLALLLVIGVLAGRRRSREFQRDYFIANRALGGVVLAMTLVATYGSVSSFVSGPGVAWQLGFGWVAFAAPQIITGFLLLGVVGKKLAVLARRTEALTVIDILHRRFNSAGLSALLATVLLVFFCAMVVGQFVGGAQIFAAITGLSYPAALILFAAVTVLYTSSGFRAVVLTDAVCAVLMLTGMITLAVTVIRAGGGWDPVMQRLATAEPTVGGVSRHLLPDAGGALSYGLLFSAWLLVGFGTVGLPQSLVRCLGYKTTGDLHAAMIVATIICGALMIGMTAIGVLARGVITAVPAGGTDAVIPQLVTGYMPPLWAGITIIGPLAATMSTVSSLLIAAAAAVLRDLKQRLRPSAAEVRRLPAMLTTLGLGLIAVLLALNPPSIVVWINMFAFGGLEAAFLWPIVLGLFWSRCNARGAWIGIAVGLGTYALAMLCRWQPGGCHPIVPAIAVALLGTVLGAYTAAPPTAEVRALFFPRRP